MPDAIAGFAFRGAMQEELGVALGRCLAEYGAWHGQAVFVAGFAQDSLAVGVKGVVADRLHQYLELGEAEGLFYSTTAKTKSNREIAHDLADHQLAMAEQGVKIAAIVMLHNALERFLWWLVRFGIVCNREQALKWIAKRNVSIEVLLKDGIDTSVDFHLEKWWEELERDTIAAKWDRLMGLVGFPSRLNSPPWHFDKQMVQAFDDVRHNAVHHDAQAAKAFDFFAFTDQLWRAQWIWVVHIASLLKIRIPASSFFPGAN